MTNGTICPHYGSMNTAIVTLATARGIESEALKKWRQRGRVPFKHRMPLLADAKQKRIALSESDFDFPPTAKPKRKARS